MCTKIVYYATFHSQRMRQMKKTTARRVESYSWSPHPKTRRTNNTTMDVINHISARVSVAAVFGAAIGIGTAIHKGHHVPIRTAGMTALSFAMVATACLVSERLVAVAMDPSIVIDDDHHGSSTNKRIKRWSWESTLQSHAAGGVLGGGLLGYLYLKRPLRGVVFFTPVMLLVGTGEMLYQDVVWEHKQRSMQAESVDSEQAP